MRISNPLYRLILPLLIAVLACSRSDLPGGDVTPVGQTTPQWWQGQPGDPPTPTLPAATPVVPRLTTPVPYPTQNIAGSPTPDATRPSIISRQAQEEYIVQAGDTLGRIAQQYGLSANDLANANGLQLHDTLYIGQVLIVPVIKILNFGPDLKLVPDSGLVYGPPDLDFNLVGYVQAKRGYLASYTEIIPARLLDGYGDETFTGARIVELVALRYSVSPRLLLALLEFHSGWVTQPRPSDNTLTYPLNRVEVGREGLYRQLAWAANQLNFGYYSWRVGGIVSYSFGDGSNRLVAPGLNAGTVGVQYYFAQVLPPDAWVAALSPEGFAKTYHSLFGNAFQRAFEPLVPNTLIQPPMQLPFEPNTGWAFTGGPHGAWDSGSGWAALDFAPPALAEGCNLSNEWVVASAPGLIVRSEYGAVVQDLDSDGYEQTGWVIFYMHIERRDRVALGAYLAAGDRLGHPSCEGGISSGTHLHIARKYNGEWVSADSGLPFILDGWVSAGTGYEYDGYLTKAGVSMEACDCRTELNTISR